MYDWNAISKVVMSLYCWDPNVVCTELNSKLSLVLSFRNLKPLSAWSIFSLCTLKIVSSELYNFNGKVSIKITGQYGTSKFFIISIWKVWPKWTNLSTAGIWAHFLLKKYFKWLYKCLNWASIVCHTHYYI